MKAVTIESLKREIDDNSQAASLYDQIAEIGGFGVFNDTYRPALDISGLSEAKQKRVQELIAGAKTPEPPKEADKNKKEGK